MLNRHVLREGIEEYRPVMMWFWNDKIDETEACRQIREFKKQGIRQFFIHPLNGFEEEYLSERYFQLIGTAVSCAQELDMKVWIYDEYNWPSGVAGGRVIRDYPEYRMRVVRYKSYWLFPDQSMTLPFSGRFLSAQALYGGEMRDITEEVVTDPDKDCVIWRNPETALCRVLVFSEQMQNGVIAAGMMSKHSWNQEGYLDTMNPAAVRKFLDTTHEQYALRFREHFGQTIAGVFTDEVNMASLSDFGADTIPWTSGFEDVFRDAKGYDLLPRLYQLVEETGDYRRVRYDYWSAITERFSTSYAAQVANWCSEHRLLLTGHCAGEENMVADLIESGSSFESLQHYHVPGIDSIFSKQRSDDEDFVLAGKMIAAVAEYTHAPRTLCETYTGSGWDLTLEQMRKIFHRLAVLGVNTIQFMGAYYSLRGMRKGLAASYPPSHSFQSPVWPYYGLFSDYISKLCYANSCGTHAADIAVIAPTTSAWCDYALRHEFIRCVDPLPARPYADLTITERTLCGVANALLQIQRDYDLLYEASLEHAEVGEGVLRFRGHEYKQLILPSLLALKDRTADTIARFLDSGGKVCFVNMLPSYTPESGDHSEAFERMSGFSLESLNLLVREKLAAGADKMTTIRWRNNCSHILSNELLRTDNAGLRNALRDCLAWNTPVLAFDDDNEHIMMLHRREPDAGLFLLVNDAAVEYTGTVRTIANGNVRVYDPETGDCHLPEVGFDGERRWFKLHFDREQAWIVEIGFEETGVEDQGIAAEQGMAETEGLTELVKEYDLSGNWGFQPERHNFLRLDVEVAVMDISEADGSPAELQEARKELWHPAADYAFPPGKGFALSSPYLARAVFEVEEVPPMLELVLDSLDEGEEPAIVVNGISVSSYTTDTVWENANRIYSLAQAVRPGVNTIVMKSRIPAWGAPHQTVFPVLRGAFAVNEARRLISPAAELNVPGSWAEQGYSDFSGKGIYRKHIVLSETDLSSCEAALHIGSCRDAVELWCNDKHVGTSLWNPHRFTITEGMIAGSNKIELRIANSLANLMERPVESGLTGEVKLLIYKKR